MRGFVPIFFISISLLWSRDHRVDGLLVEVCGDVIVVAHRPIANYMPAMTMPVRVRNPNQLRGLAPGMRVRFDLDRKGASKLRRVLPEEGDIPVSTPAPLPGTTIPDFTLIDQSGRQVSLLSLRGQVLAVQFIYTRCPMPDVCPRLAASFAAVHRRFGNSDLALHYHRSRA
ncbi:MAG: copper-binding protein [Bryobacteraceae bacterium]